MQTLWKPEHIEFLKNNYTDSGSIWCAEFLPFAPKQISNKASKIGLKVSEKQLKLSRSVVASRCRPELCKVNCDFFSYCNTKEASYILGLLWADGWLSNGQTNKHRISIELQKEDMDVIMPVFLLSGDWTIATRHRENRKPQTTLTCTNKKLYEFLSDAGYTKKSGCSASKILNLIPNHLVNYWHRGFFDGDGCIYVKNNLIQASLAGCFEQDWTFITDLLDKLSIKNNIARRDYKTSKSSAVRFNGKKSCTKFADYIYQGGFDGLGLQRKWSKFNSLNALPHDDQ